MEGITLRTCYLFLIQIFIDAIYSASDSLVVFYLVIPFHGSFYVTGSHVRERHCFLFSLVYSLVTSDVAMTLSFSAIRYIVVVVLNPKVVFSTNWMQSQDNGYSSIKCLKE